MSLTLEQKGCENATVSVTATDKAKMKDEMLRTLRSLVTMCGTMPAIPRKHFITFHLTYDEDVTVRWML